MTPSDFAARLNGRTYGSEMTKSEEAEARGMGYIVIFGYSDDNVELRGAIYDEIGAYEGTTFRITPTGLMPSWDSLDHDEGECEAYFKKKAGPGFDVTANWDDDGYSWTYTTDKPHATFEIFDEGEKYCRGIVVRMIAEAAPQGATQAAAAPQSESTQ